MSSSSSSATTSTHQNSAFTQQSLDTSKKTSTPIAVNIRASPVSQVSFQKPIPQPLHQHQLQHQHQHYSTNPLQKNDLIINSEIIHRKIKEKKALSQIDIDQTVECLKYLNANLEVYLKNTIQSLISIHRKRNYTKEVPISAKHKRINIETFNYKNTIIAPKQQKVSFFPYKTYSLFYTSNNETCIRLLDAYKGKQRLLNEDNDDVDFFVSKSNKNDKKEYHNNNNNDSDDSGNEAVNAHDNVNDNDNSNDNAVIKLNIFNSWDVTQNYKLQIPKEQKRKIQLKDLIIFLEKNERTPLHRILLHKAHLILTAQFNSG